MKPDYFKVSFRWKIAGFVEEIGELIIQLAVRIRKSDCKCKWCQRDREAIINDAEETAMELSYVRDQLEENLLTCEVSGRRSR